MFFIVILIGIYSYLIFALGLLGILYKSHIVILTVIYIVIVWYFTRNFIKVKILQYFPVLKKFAKIIKTKSLFNFLIILVVIQAIVNFIGVLGPEFGFDALWYHLTLPKIYLINHSISHISGGLLYYSDMPKLTEMLYVAALSFDNETLAKIIHFSFGILTLIAIYKISRKFFSKEFSLLAAVLFYSNLVVGWMSITAYVDLARTFFETMALWGFINWRETKSKKWFIASAIMLGLAISTKLLAIGSLFIFSILIIWYFSSKKKYLKNLFIGLFIYWVICLLIPLPWFIFSFVHTGNPIYPFFTNIYKVGLSLQIINPFFHKSDSISIVYIIIPFLIPFVFKRLRIELKVISLYSFLAFVIWYLTPKTDWGRFILPYLPAFSILSIGVIRLIGEIRIRYIFIGAIIFFSLFSIVYRLGANLKYIPVIIGKKSKADFLKNHLNFSFGDFYDVDGYFKNHIKQNDMVLLYGFHNLYYVDFPFIDSSWVKKGDKFSYIAVQNSPFPQRFKNWNLMYNNPITHVKLYSKGDKKWEY